jgi:hypothetical protein
VGGSDLSNISQERWLRIELPYATFAIKVRDDVVIDAAPIAAWMIGKRLPFIKRWIEQKGGRYEELQD